VQMVPVNVAQEQVKVQDAQVSVKIRDLEGQARFEKIARELQVELAKIAADKDARIAAAQAFGQALANAHMTVWGDPTTVQRMTAAFFQGQSAGMFVEGLDRSLPPDAKKAAVAGAAAVGATIGAVAKKVVDMATGKNDPAEPGARRNPPAQDEA